MNDDIKEHLKKHGVAFEESDSLEYAAGKADVIYQTRIQKERFSNPEEYEKAKGVYIIDNKIMSILSKDSIVMHPLPRVDEIRTEADTDPRSAYFRQAHNGLFIRMALLSLVLEN